MVLSQALSVRMVFSYSPTHSPTSPGAFTPNISAGHIPPPTPVSSRHEVTYGHDAVGSLGSSGYLSANSSTRPPTAAASRATGSKPLPSCLLVILNRVPNSSTSKGHDPQAQRYYGSTASAALGSGPTTSNVHQSRQCKLPGCRKAAIFDPSINEQREFCEDHIKYVLCPL